MPDVGDTLDRYVIEGVLGEGGMGRVYRALDPRLGRRVALKVLLADGASPSVRADAAARMVREARAAAAFNHPNVVAIHDVGEVDGAPFITMELVSGTTLRGYVGNATLSIEQKVEWLQHVARGLGAAHRAGLVHRDIKPENVMVTTDGAIKILDFGIARRAEDAADVDSGAPTAAAPLASLTAEGMMIGTPQYMPPEQLQATPLDGRADQFAWGVLAWELFTGALPWGAARNGAQLVAAVLSMPVTPLCEVVPGVPAAVSDAVARALSKERDKRFATMEELLVALEGRRAVTPAPGSQDLALQPTTAQPATPQVAAAADLAMAPAAPRTVADTPITTGAPAVGAASARGDVSSGRRRRPLRWVVIAAVVGLSTQLPNLLHKFGVGGHGGVASSAGGAGGAAGAAAADGPIVGACPAGTKTDCSSASSGWCDVSGKFLACCAPGLVAVGTDGECDCPPGGEEPDAAAGACHKASTSGVSEAGDVVASLRPKFRTCYNRGLKENEALEGRTTIEVKIAPDGRVFHVRVQEGRMASPSVQKCLLDEIRTARFAPPAGGSASLLIPVTFVQQNDAKSDAQRPTATTDAATSTYEVLAPCGQVHGDVAPANAEEACTASFTPWCTPSGHQVGCCAKGLVAEGTDGVCVCAPGGPYKGDAPAPGCPAHEWEFTNEAIQSRVRASFPKFRLCYEGALRREKGSKGTVSVYFGVAPHGDVLFARVKETSLNDAEAQRCLVKEFRALKFPPPQGGFGTVTYPIVFGG
jgi:hypothetical protein